MSRKCRNGIRRINRPLIHRLKPCPVIRRLDGRPWHPTNWLAMACRELSQHVRRRAKSAREAPHLFGRHARRYFQDTLREVEHQREWQSALEKVYGPSPPGQEWRPDSVWQERYGDASSNKRFFLKWFKETYGA